MAAEELEAMAARYAREAMQLDSQGSRGLAIQKYQRAVEILLKLVNLYPNTPHARIYLERVKQYQDRINTLQSQISSQTPIERAPPGSEARYDQLVLKEKPNVKWGDVVDLEVVKRALREAIVYPTLRPDLFPLGWPRGILLFGPPGCGKTYIAAAAATEIDAVFYVVDAASIMSKWLGESEKNIAILFNDARKIAESNKSVVIFIDEIDSLTSVRIQEVGGEVRARNQLLKEMDSIHDKGKNYQVYVVGATNKPWILDDPFIRRFQKRIYVPLPDYTARIELFKLYTKNLKLDSDIDFKELAKKCDGYSAADIRDICQGVQIKVVREFFESNNDISKGEPRLIRMDDFLSVISERKPSVSREIVKAYEKWLEQYAAL
jgi:vacuolar protein-sorting-associated protein 4